METPRTCGQGLAENSILPGKLGELVVAMAENLQMHIRALDIHDRLSRQEYEVYVQLANEQRETGARLLATAHEMAAARELPMGRHEFNESVNREALEAFEKFVNIKQELLVLLQQSAEQDQAMLLQMRNSSAR